MTSAAGFRPAVPTVEEALAEFLARVERRFESHLASDLPAVRDLCGHVERYRGKMLRPALVGLCGLASLPPGGVLTDDHATLGAVCEMVHMATLVHDDVLDEADTRRRGTTVNRLHGNETAVILGDYLIASAFHLCSTLDSQSAALLVGAASMTMCAGELLQLHHRDDYSLDEATYFEIVDRKTAALIGLACRLGAAASGAPEPVKNGVETFGRKVGVAFQIQDDILDLTGDPSVVGKSVGRDLAKGKLTLPMILHLAGADPDLRGRTLELLETACSPSGDAGAAAAAHRLGEMLSASGAVESAGARARGLVAQGRRVLVGSVPDSPARKHLLSAADAVTTRSF